MRVKRVTQVTLAEPVPVYDLTVRGTENFALAAGPFVHNSKDVSDAVAGALFAASMHRGVMSDAAFIRPDGSRVTNPNVGRRPMGSVRPK